MTIANNATAQIVNAHGERAAFALAVKGRKQRLVLTTTCGRTNLPSLLHWSRSGYQTALAEHREVGSFIQVFAEGYGLGVILAEQLLRGELPTHPVEEEEDQALFIYLTDEQAECFRARPALVGSSRFQPLGEAVLLLA